LHLPFFLLHLFLQQSECSWHCSPFAPQLVVGEELCRTDGAGVGVTFTGGTHEEWTPSLKHSADSQQLDKFPVQSPHKAMQLLLAPLGNQILVQDESLE